MDPIAVKVSVNDIQLPNEGHVTVGPMCSVDTLKRAFESNNPLIVERMVVAHLDAEDVDITDQGDEMLIESGLLKAGDFLKLTVINKFININVIWGSNEDYIGTLHVLRTSSTEEIYELVGRYNQCKPGFRLMSRYRTIPVSHAKCFPQYVEDGGTVFVFNQEDGDDGYGDQESSSDEPDDSSDEPDDGDEPDNSGDGQDNGGDGQDNGGDEPDNGGDEPNNSGDEPDNGGDEPDNGGDEPDNGGDGQDNGGDGQDNGGDGQDNGGDGQDNGGANDTDPGGGIYINSTTTANEIYDFVGKRGVQVLPDFTLECNGIPIPKTDQTLEELGLVFADSLDIIDDETGDHDENYIGSVLVNQSSTMEDVYTIAGRSSACKPGFKLEHNGRILPKSKQKVSEFGIGDSETVLVVNADSDSEIDEDASEDEELLRIVYGDD